jgi:MraZ protein
MLLGEYEHTIDEKGRLTLPVRFREALAEAVVLTRGMDGCLYAYSTGDWQRVVDSELANLDSLTREGRLMQRYFFAGAAEVQPDRQGRIVIPAPLADYAKLTREVVIAGVYDHLEIWPRDAWRDQLKEVEGSAEHVAERLAAQRD